MTIDLTRNQASLHTQHDEPKNMSSSTPAVHRLQQLVMQLPTTRVSRVGHHAGYHAASGLGMHARVWSAGSSPVRAPCDDLQRSVLLSPSLHTPAHLACPRAKHVAALAQPTCTMLARATCSR